MDISTRQYKQAKEGRFMSAIAPALNEEVILIMQTARGTRILPVGRVSEVVTLSAVRHSVRVCDLKHVEGFY